jgi:hypothetical protein
VIYTEHPLTSSFRLVLANTEELHEKIERLCSRIRALEDALRSLQANFSDSPHPLLQDALLTLKAPNARHDFLPGPSATPIISRIESSRTDEDHIVDAFGMPCLRVEHIEVVTPLQIGTLAIGSSGETEFLGKTARSDVNVALYEFFTFNY